MNTVASGPLSRISCHSCQPPFWTSQQNNGRIGMHILFQSPLTGRERSSKRQAHGLRECRAAISAIRPGRNWPANIPMLRRIPFQRVTRGRNKHRGWRRIPLHFCRECGVKNVPQLPELFRAQAQGIVADFDFDVGYCNLVVAHKSLKYKRQQNQRPHKSYSANYPQNYRLSRRLQLAHTSSFGCAARISRIRDSSLSIFSVSFGVWPIFSSRHKSK